jgi:hypothetical protein
MRKRRVLYFVADSDQLDFFFSHRAFAALRARAVRSWGVIYFLLCAPPLRPISAAVIGFFFLPILPRVLHNACVVTNSHRMHSVVY